MDLNKKIADLDLPYQDVVLEDIFFIPANEALRTAPAPVTIYDLAKVCARPGELVWQKLHMVQKLSKGVVLDEDACRALFERSASSREAPLLIDVRFSDSFLKDPMQDAMHLPTMTTEEWQLAFPKDRSTVVFSEDGRKAFSAAMWLREQGRLQTFCTKIDMLKSVLLGFFLCLTCLFGVANDSIAVDAEAFESNPSNARVTSKECHAGKRFHYVGQLFVQRPAIKILFNKDDADEPKGNEEVFDGMNYEAESMNAAGVKFAFDNFGIMASRRIGNNNSISTQKFEDYQIVHFTELFGLNVRFQHYVGMIQIMNFRRRISVDSDTPAESSNRREYIKRPDASVTHRSGALHYLLYGRNFSMNGAFGEGAPEIRRGYGFPLFIAGTKTKFDTGSFLVDERYAFYFKEASTLNQVTTSSGYLGGGAAGTLPFGKFYVSGVASIGIGMQKMEAVYTDYATAKTDGAGKADLRLVFGGNFRDFFALTTFDLEGTTFRIGDINATVQSDMISAAAGMRF